METIKAKHFKCLTGGWENGVYVRVGKNTFSFDGLVEEINGEKVQYTFTVEGVADDIDAINLVDTHYCGFFDKYSARNIRREKNNGKN